MLKRIIFLAILFLGVVVAQELSPSKYAKLVQKGEKIALTLCDENKLSQIKSKNFQEIVKKIEAINPCIKLNARNKEALAYFMMAGQTTSIDEMKGKIEVPQEVKCPVCGMFVAKYPKWVARIDIEAQTYYFDGVKDMMKFYLFDGDFPYERKKIKQIEVTDFYTLHAIEAKKAFYVIGSDVYGPMGNELIPFDTKEAAQNFMMDHRGQKIILFTDITPQIVMGLDGLDYTE